MSLWKSGDIYTTIRESLNDIFIHDEIDNASGTNYYIKCDLVFDDEKPYLIATIQEETYHYPSQISDKTVINNKFKITVECMEE